MEVSEWLTIDKRESKNGKLVIPVLVQKSSKLESLMVVLYLVEQRFASWACLSRYLSLVALWHIFGDCLQKQSEGVRADEADEDQWSRTPDQYVRRAVSAVPGASYGSSLHFTKLIVTTIHFISQRAHVGQCRGCLYSI